MIVVNAKNFATSVSVLLLAEKLAVDTETTGLFAWKKDRLFSIQFSDEKEDYYFNFQPYKTGEPVLDFEIIKQLQPLFLGRTLFLQNAKFDMAFLWKEGIRFDGADIHDTEVAGRIIRNDHTKYSLDEQSKRELGESKDDRVMEYLKKHKLFKAVTIPGKDTVFKEFHFNMVPFDIIAPYGCHDTRLTYRLGVKQIGQLEDMSAFSKPGSKTVMDVHNMEKRLIHTCFRMEKAGIQIDKEYCNEADKYETTRIDSARRRFVEQTGSELVDSGQCLGPIFEDLGFRPGKTASGEHEITDSFLDTVDHPLGAIVQDFRGARKRANTYFKSYVYFADKEGAVHPQMKQSGTRTGRFSYMDPNLQNIPSEDDDSPYPIRRAFVPRDGYFFLSVDYKQMEFRMMLDEAKEHGLIAKINEGLDPHDATAELTGLSRKAAKTLNFGLLYGMGIIKLAFSIMKLTAEQKTCLKIYEKHQQDRTLMLMDEKQKEVAMPIINEMKAFKRQYFNALPMVENFILQCSGAVKERHTRDPGNGWLKTWYGRRSYFSDPQWAYKAANAKIQGGTADVVKLAMNALDEWLLPNKSRMLVQIHDELLFEIAFEEMNLIEEIMRIMETAYPYRFIPLTCSMSYSLKSFYDVVEQDPRAGFIEAERNDIQKQNQAAIRGTAELLDS